MFKGKITKLTSGTAMLGVAPTLALQAQEGVQAASGAAAKGLLESNVNVNSVINFKKVGLGAIFTCLIVGVGWYAACVIFNKLALERLREERLKTEGLIREIGELDGKISAYEEVEHDTEIDENDPLKELKQKIKERKNEIKKNEDNFEKVKKEYNKFFGEEEIAKREKSVKNLEKAWKEYEDKNFIVKELKEIKISILEDLADLLVKAQDAKIKYEKNKKKKKFVEENTKEKLMKTFDEKKKQLVGFLEDFCKNKSGSYEIFENKLREEDKKEIGVDMVSLESAIGVIRSYDFDASEETFEKLSKYRQGILGQLLYEVRSYKVFNAKLNRYESREFFSPIKSMSFDKEKEKKDIVALLKKIKDYLGEMICCQTNLRKANEYKKEIDNLSTEALKLEELNRDLQRECKEKNADWEDFEKRIKFAKERFESLEKSEQYNYSVKKSGFEEYFAQFEKLGEIDKQISIKDVAGKIKDLDDEVQKLKPEKTKKELEQEIEKKGEVWGKKLGIARGLQEKDQESKDALKKELSELQTLKKQKEEVLERLRDKKNGEQDLNSLKEKEKELSENIYNFSINPKKYYNEVSKLLEV